jgi:hypothetical protein
VGAGHGYLLGVGGVERVVAVGVLGLSLAMKHFRCTSVPGTAEVVSSSSYASRSHTWHVPMALRLSGEVLSPGAPVLGACGVASTIWNAECTAGRNGCWVGVAGGDAGSGGCGGVQGSSMDGLYTLNVAIRCSIMPRRSGVTTVVCRMRSRSSSGVEERDRGDVVWRSGDGSIIYVKSCTY